MNDHNGNTSLSELIRKLALAEQEDVAEDDNPLWIRPLVRKKKAVKKGSSMAHVFTDEFHNPGHDFSSIGLAGVIGGYRLKMRKRDLDLYKRLWWITTRGFDVPIQGVSGCAHNNNK
jgi:hypothetical protein